MFIDYLILGSGYTGPFLRNYIQSQEPDSKIYESSRIEDKKEVVFNLQDESTWSNLPHAKKAFLLFAIDDSEIAQKFFDSNIEKLGRLVLCSSTGFFITTFPDQEVTEKTALDLSNKRAAAEESLRLKGAIVVHASGIYGPKRSPVDWLETGRVSPSDKFVNLIHVEDLCQFLYQAVLAGNPSDRYIASDNHPMRWKDISLKIEKDYGFEFNTQTNTQTKRSSKQVRNQKSIEKLNIYLKYPNVFQGIRALMNP